MDIASDVRRDAHNSAIEEAAKVAEGRELTEMYQGHRGNDHANWKIDGSSGYGNGRTDAAREIRALAQASPPLSPD